MASTTIPRRAIVMLIVLTLVWGTNWPLFPIAVREISVWTFRASSMVCAGLLLLLIAKLRGLPMTLPRRHWRTVVLGTLFYLVLWNLTSTYAALLIPSGQAAVLGFTMPLWSALISWLVLGEKMRPRLVLAIVLGGTGVTLLMVDSFSAYASAPLGLALGLAAAIGWAIGTLILQRGKVDVPVLVLTGWQLLLGAVPMTIGAALLGDGNWFLPSWQTFAVVIWIVLVPMSIGNVCWFGIVSLLPGNIAGLSSVLVPVVAMISGAIINGEPLGPLQWLAMATCATSLVLALGGRSA